MNISFMLTEKQVLARQKTVTRRLGWKRLKAGQVLQGVRKGMGLKKGEKIVNLATIRVIDVRREPLSAITDDDCAREGFPEMNAAEFVSMFCRHMKCQADTPVTRIEFEYLD